MERHRYNEFAAAPVDRYARRCPRASLPLARQSWANQRRAKFRLPKENLSTSSRDRGWGRAVTRGYPETFTDGVVR